MDQLEHSLREAHAEKVLDKGYGSAVLAGAVLIPLVSGYHAAVMRLPDKMRALAFQLFTARL
ncbi:MAG: hypothetical protein ACLTD8_04280 [Acutalibacteraceae bacterium]